MESLKPIYEDQPDKLAKLDQQLEAVATELATPKPDEPTEYIAASDNWEITLETSPAGRLIGASAVLCGSNRYAFERDEEGSWAADTSRSMASQLLDTHFYNLVQRATREGLEWNQAAAAAA